MADKTLITDILDSNGLTLSTYDEVLTYIQDSLNEIYATDGDTINFDSETADGQFTNILAQIGSDIRELAREIYNSFNPDNCQGSVQDQRYALNYLTRKAGAYTIQPIEIKVNQTITLQGLDESSDDDNVGAYTVSDDTGNLWFLLDTTTIEYIDGDDTETLLFRAQYKGDVHPTINTITNQVTKVLGVVSVNNPLGVEDLGSEEESDYEFRLRRNRSTAIKGQNNIDAMLGQILDLKGTTDATIWVNNTDEEDDKGVPAFSVWVVVDGSVANSDVAEVIYQNSAGLPTYSTNTNAVEINVPTVAGQVFNVKFNRVATTNLYIKFDFKKHKIGRAHV